MDPRHKNAKRLTQGNSQKGFSLIELLVVVAVILIIAAIAIPNYLRSKMNANEASAVQNLRSITTAEALYSSTYGISYSSDLVSLSGNTVSPDQAHAELIDQVLGSGVKSGYTFSYSAVATDSQGFVVDYAVTANPLVPGNTGQRYFYTDQTYVIRWNPSVPAGPSDSAL
jgi:type IV pilus assembly protein PilA